MTKKLSEVKILWKEVTFRKEVIKLTISIYVNISYQRFDSNFLNIKKYSNIVMLQYKNV